MNLSQQADYHPKHLEDDHQKHLEDDHQNYRKDDHQDHLEDDHQDHLELHPSYRVVLQEVVQVLTRGESLVCTHR